MTFQGVNALAIGSKLIYHKEFTYNAFAVQCWCLVFTILVWTFVFVYAKIKEKQFEDIIDF